jgi:polyisoprenoid-binding protein YceI
MPVSARSFAPLLLGSVLLVAAGCEDPARDKPAAKVAEPVAPAAAPAPSAATVNYAFSEDGSKLAFVGAKVSLKHDGSFQKFRGNVTVPGGDMSKGSVDFEVELASVVTDAEKLTGHLKSPDFFDVEKFPKSTFKSTSVSPGSEPGTYTITGNLDLHGVTKSISFPAKISSAGETLDVASEFKINRKDFGIVYPGMPDDLIHDDVVIKLDIKAKKAG